MTKWTRRAFLTAGGVIGGGLALGVGTLILTPNRLSNKAEEQPSEAQLNTWITVLPDSSVRVIVPHCDMGQGAQTGCAMMAAEEMNADWDRVEIVEAPPEMIYANDYISRKFAAYVVKPAAVSADFMDSVGLQAVSSKLIYALARIKAVQITGASASIRATGAYGMRLAGATALSLLISVAARRWAVPEQELRAEKSVIYHDASGRQLSFGELAEEASTLSPPATAQLKARSEFTLIGSSQGRHATAQRVDGSMIYGIDHVEPGMLYASIEACPVPGGTLRSVDHSAALGLPGVERVVELDNAVAVVARSTWQAISGLRALQPVWDYKGNEQRSSESIEADYRKEIEARSGDEETRIGDGYAALEQVEKKLEVEYVVPYLAHAAMEPLSATAKVADGTCEVWVGNQSPMHARSIAAAASGVAWEDVTIHSFPIGGAFGRRLPAHMDYLDQSVRIAKALSPRPVQLTWTREEDTRQDLYRPLVVGQYKGGLDQDGRPHAWISGFNGHAVLPGRALPHPSWEIPYAIPHQSHTHVRLSSHIREGSLRGVEYTQHGFFTETFIDELAHSAGRDPYLFRRGLLQKQPRHLAVLDKAASEAGWDTALAPGRGRGIAIVESFETIVAVVIQARLTEEGKLSIERCIAAVDSGYVVNPDAARAQIEGGVIFGLSAGLMSEISISRGRVMQSNFLDHQVCRMADIPDVEVHLLESDGPLGGMGEPGVPPAAPALCNAVFAISGKRIRRLPIGKQLA